MQIDIDSCLAALEPTAPNNLMRFGEAYRLVIVDPARKSGRGWIEANNIEKKIPERNISLYSALAT